MNVKPTPTACPIEQAVLFLKEDGYAHRPLILAFSGGMDSSVLLHALTRQGLQPHMVHVHHGLQACADDWIAHAQHQARIYGVPCHIASVTLAEVTRRGMEDRARSARYAALWQCVPEHGVLLTAHHQRDQAETLLLRLLRGTGVKGLAAIHSEQTYDQDRSLCRPLISIAYQDLVSYAHRHHLVWVEDPTNTQAVALRNQIRHRLLPLMHEYQPAIERKLAETAQHCQEAESLLREMASEDWHLLALGEHSWRLSAWQALRWSRAKQALAYYLSLNKESLTGVQWQQVKQQFYERANPQTHPELCLSQHKLLVSDDLAYCLPLSWLKPVPRGYEEISCQPRLIAWTPWLQIKLSLPAGKMNIRLQQRQGGERLLVDGRARSLKSWLQKQQIPHWQMSLWPVIYNENNQLLGWSGMPTSWWAMSSIHCDTCLIT